MSSPRWEPSRGTQIALVIAPLAAAAAVHADILGGFFAFDDFLHLYNVANEPLSRFAFRTHGGHALVSYRIAFWALWHLFGLDARGWFIVVLLTHLFNTWLLGAILRRVTGEPFVPAAASSLWGISPLASGALGWLSVYSHVLVVPFLGLVLHDLARIRSGAYRVTPLSILKWNALLLAASNAFGTGTVMAIGAPIWATALVWDQPARRRVGRAVLPALLIVPVAFFAVHIIDLRMSGAVAPRLPLHLFSFWDLLDTLHTTWRLLAYGLASSLGGGLIAVGTRLLSTPTVGAGPFAGASTETVSAVSQGIAVLLLATLAPVVWRSKASTRALVVGSLLLALCGYGSVALGRSKIAEAMGRPATWITLQPRYQYAPSFALWIALAVAARAAGLARLRPRALAATLIAWVGVQLAFAIPSARALNMVLHSTGRDRFDAVVERELEQIRRTPPGQVATVFNWNEKLAPFATNTAFPGWAAVFVIAFPDDVVEGRTVRFFIPDPDTLRALRADPGTRIAHLVVGLHAKPSPPAPSGDDAAEARPSLPPAPGSD